MIKLFGGSDSQEKMDFMVDKLEYKSGETVSGKLVIDGKKDVNVRSFRFIVEGKEKTNVTVSEPYTRSDSQGNSTTSYKNVTYSDSNVFLSINLEQFLSKSSNTSLITNTDKDSGIIIQKGSTEIPFEFPLPDNALSSYKGRNASINYEIKATIDKKLRSDINTSTSINVVSIKEEKNNNNNSTIYVSDKSSKKGLYIKLIVAKNIYKIGDTIEGTIFIGKPSSIATTIRSIKMKLIGTEYAIARGKKVTTVIQNIDNEIINWKENEETPFKVKIPETITKSYRSKLSELYWEIKVTVDIPMDSDLNALAKIKII